MSNIMDFLITISTLLLPIDRLGKLSVPEKWRQELEERREKRGVHRPPLLLRRQGEDPADEHAVRHNLQPRVGEPRGLLQYQR